MAIKVHSENLILINNLNRTSDRLATAMGRLSTGYRVNTASDGAAELMLSKSLEKQISGLSVCNDNANMAKSLLSVADGSLSQVTAMAQRIRDIALSSANGVYGEAERQAYQSEVDGLVEEIKRQVNDARYNDYKLFYENNSPTLKTNAGASGASATGAVGTYKVQKMSQEEAEALGYTCVSTAQELKDALVTGDANCKVMLMNDINLDELGLDATGSNWTAVGDNTAKFAGTIDGNGYTIRNLKINSTKNHQGLFGRANADSVIKNLNVDNASVVSTGACIGGLVGTNEGIIENCSVTNTTVKSEYERTGGIAGQNIGSISNCKVDVNIEGNNITGGLAGVNFNKIISCSASGNVKGNGHDTGGFVGANAISDGFVGDIQNCSTSTNVIGIGEAIGGFTGSNQGTAKITSCYTTGQVEGNRDGIGGFIGCGYSSSSISSCYATGTVTGNSSYVGGFIGAAMEASTITDSYATGNATGIDTIGGFAGIIQDASSVTSCHSAGNVMGTGGQNIGGFVGTNYGDAIVASCYAVGDVTGSKNNVGGFVGCSYVNSTITSSYAKGNVKGSEQNTGGFAGGTAQNAKITSCYATGNVEGNSQTGGFIGLSESIETLSNCYATGNVTATGAHTGGFVGGSVAGTLIDSCYSTGDVNGKSCSGGFVGTVQNGTISNSYSTGNTTGNTSSTGAFSGQARDGATLSNYAFANSSGSASSGIGTGGATGASITAGKEINWFENKNNLISIVGENWDYSYFDSNLTFQIGVNAGLLNTSRIDLSFGVNNFNVDVLTAENSRTSLSAIDELIEYTTQMQGKIGSAMNVMDSVLGNNTQAQINLVDSNSRLIDADVAKESAEFVKNQIRQNLTASLLVQTGTNMSEVLLALYGL